MYADDHGRHITTQLSKDCPPGPVAGASVEERYRQAQARLFAAQQERMEAGIEFLAARAALREWMEGIWPGQEGRRPATEAAFCPASGASR